MSGISEHGRVHGDSHEGGRHFAYVAHHIPGRVRIRVPAAKRNPQLLRRVADAAAKMGGVKAVQSNPVTGSLLVHYQRSGFDRLVELLAEALEGIVLLTEPELLADEVAIDPASAPAIIAKAVAEVFRFIDRQVKVATGNLVDLRLLVPLAAITAALAVITESVSTPLWLNLAIFSMNSFLQLNRI